MKKSNIFAVCFKKFVYKFKNLFMFIVLCQAILLSLSIICLYNWDVMTVLVSMG